METLRYRSSKRKLLTGALIFSVLAGCGTSQRQAATAPPNVASAPEAAPSSVRQALPYKTAMTRAASSPVVSTKQNTAPVASTKQSTVIVLSQMHNANLLEITLGKIAEEKASSSEVRAYADQLVQDHANVDQAVVAMAQQSGAHLTNNAAAHREKRHQAAQEKQLERS